MMMMTFYQRTFLALFFLVAGIGAQCSMPTSISSSVEDGTDNFNDADQVGGTGAIDKIVKIDVYAGNFLFNFVVSKICTTYKLKSGTPAEEERCNGNGGSKQGTALFGDGAYLIGVDHLGGNYVDHVVFYSSSGEKFGPWGGKTNQAQNHGLKKGNSVIKSFMGTAGSVVDRLRAMFETNRIYKVREQNPIFTQTAEPMVIDDITFDTPQAIEVNNNLEGSIARALTLSFTEEVKTIETTSVTSATQYDAEISRTVSAGIDLKVFSASVETTLRVGASFSTSRTSANTHEYKTTFSREIPVEAPPYTQVTAQVFFRRAQYEFSWTIPVVCTYTFAPDQEYQANEGFKGTMAGSQAFPQGYVKFTEIRNPNAPTATTAISTGPPTPTAPTAISTGPPTAMITDGIPTPTVAEPDSAAGASFALALSTVAASAGIALM